MLARDGTYFVIAAGLAYHAGAGSYAGVSNGNACFIGIEAENTGLDDDSWPDVQMEAYRRGVAALLKQIGADHSLAIGHKEYAPRRKIDLRVKIAEHFSVTFHKRSVAKLLHRLGMKRLQPRPYHPKKDAAAQEVFLVNSLI